MIAIARRPATAPIAVLAAALGLLLLALVLREPVAGNPAKPAEHDGYSPIQTVTLQPASAPPATEPAAAQASGAQQVAPPTTASAPESQAPASTAGQPPAAQAPAPAAQAQIATTAPPQSDNQQLPPNSRVPTTDPSSGGAVPPSSR